MFVTRIRRAFSVFLKYKYPNINIRIDMEMDINIKSMLVIGEWENIVRTVSTTAVIGFNARIYLFLDETIVNGYIIGDKNRSI